MSNNQLSVFVPHDKDNYNANNKENIFFFLFTLGTAALY